MSAFWFGFSAISRGYRQIFSSHALKTWSLLPLIAAILVFLVFGTLGIMQILTWNPVVVSGILSAIGLQSEGWLGWVIALSLWPFWLLLLALGLYLIARIFVAPLYALLAERALVELGLIRSGPVHPLSWVKLLVHMTWVSFTKALLFSVLGLFLFIFSLIPGLNILAAVGFIHIVAFDICDYSFEAMGWSLQTRFRYFRSQWLAFSGFACSLGITMLIPGLSLLLLPGAVVGGAMILHRTSSGYFEP